MQAGPTNWKWSLGILAIALLVSLALPANSNGAAQSRPSEVRGESLRAALRSPMPEGGIRITVTLREPAAGQGRAVRRARINQKQAGVLERLSGRGFTLGHRYRSLSGLSGWADAGAIEALARDPEVMSVDVDRIAYAALTQGKSIVGANTAHSFGVTGSGIGVAMLDTGIDTDHPHLSASLVVEACFCDDAPGPNGCCPNGRDTQTGAGSAEDDEGHGSGTTGVIVSSSVTNLGVAPDATIAALKVLGANGSGSFSDVADALDWVITNHVTYGIRLINISLSDGGQYNNGAANPCTGSNTADAITQLKALGVSTFAASGNDGHDAGISFPACVPDAISVGGVYDQTFSQVGWCGATCTPLLCTDQPATVDTFVCHTNSGALLDILAPDFRTLAPAIGGGTTNLGGTSIASPYAAAEAALLLEADATLTTDEILTLLTTSAPLVTNADNGLSFPRGRVDLAIPLLLAVCGNGAVDVGEQCDDGNTSPGDCCDAACQYEVAASPCDDANACTLTDACDGAGLCVGAGVLSCDDANACTDDTCSPATGCQFDNNAASCNDLDACTTGDVCSGGTCTSGSALVCDDLNVCTNDSCVPATGCQFDNNTAACDDANACTSLDVCSGGACLPGTPVACDDSNLCTDDSCVPATGCAFLNNAAPCDDADSCTSADSCAGGTCAPGTPVTCDDLNGCTDDSCVPATGCQFDNNTASCDDADACTGGDVCSSGVCSSGAPIVCDDLNFCTDDSCVPASGCQFDNNVALCDDADACTNGDVCAAGICVSGTALDCDDLDECTADGCDEGTGCFNDAIAGCPGPPVPSATPTALLGIVLAMLATGLATGVWNARSGRRNHGAGFRR